MKRPLDFSPFSDVLADFGAEQAAAIDAQVAGKTIPQIQELLASGSLSSEQLVL